MLGCDGGPMTIPVAPWSMWGQAEIVPLSGAVSRASPQLAKVSFKRPETWSFLLYAQILGGTSPGNIVVDFDLQLGLGLVTLQLPTFLHMQFSGPIAATNPITKWVQSVNAPAPNDAVAAVTPLIDKITAQDIQCSARLSSPDPAAAGIFVRVGAFFAPLSHVRPDWYRTTLDDPHHKATDEAKFQGAEIGGS